MKNKGLISVIIIIGTVLVGSFIFEKNKMAEKAEGQAKIMTVGVLQFVSHPALDEIYRGIQAGLAEEGYIDQDNLNIEFQNGQADQSKLNTMSQQLIDKKADVLVGIATPAAQALANNTKDIPIVLGAITDPKSANLVADNQRPGGNITGVSDQSPVDAQLALALKLLPDLKTIGVLYSSAEDNSAFQAEKLVSEAEKLGVTVKNTQVPSSNEISQIVQVMSSEVDAMYLPTDQCDCECYANCR